MNDQQTSVTQLKELVRRFVEARQWDQSHLGKNLSMSIAIEAAELMEHFQWGDNSDYLPGHMPVDELAKIKEEIADIVIYSLSFCNHFDIDLAAAVEAKVAKNETRFPVKR